MKIHEYAILIAVKEIVLPAKFNLGAKQAKMLQPV
jgi:hypothetical protein